MTEPAWVQNLIPWAWLSLAISLVVAVLPINPLGSPETLGLLLAGTLECAAVYLLLRPRSYHHNAGRALAALTTLLLALGFWAARAQPTPPPPYLMHLIWLMGMTVVLCALVGYSLWTKLIARPRT